MLKNILLTIAFLFKTPELCSTKHKRYKVMIVIVLKTSTFKRVSTRLRNSGCLEIFLSLSCRFFHDSGLTYLYYGSLSDMCSATYFLSDYNAVYRVLDVSL